MLKENLKAHLFACLFRHCTTRELAIFKNTLKMKFPNQLNEFPMYSKTGIGNWLLFIGGAAFFGFVGYKVCAEAFEKQPFNQFILLLGVTAILFALCSLLAPWFYYRIVIWKDCIVFTRFWGLSRQVVWRNDLVSYEVLKKKAKYTTWDLLKLYTRDGHYSINSQMYANFLRLQLELTTDLRQTYNEENRTKARAERSERVIIYLFWVIAIGGTAILGMRAFFYRVDESELVSYSCVLSGKPAIETTTSNRRTRQFLYLPIPEHPGFSFNIHTPTFHATYATDLVRNLGQDDTLFIKVSRTDYETKIAKTKPIGFWEKNFGGYRHIKIYELTASDNTGYLTLSNYERVYRKEQKFNFWMFVVMMGAVVGLYWWKAGGDD